MHLYNKTSDKVFEAALVVFMILLSASMLLPLVNVLCLSLEPNHLAIEPGRVHIIPKAFTLKAYQQILENGQLLRSFANSAIITVGGAALGVLLTAMMGYGLCNSSVKGVRFVSYFIMFTMMFSGGMIPSFILVKDLGLTNNLLSLILPSAMSAYNVILMRSFFRSLPPGLMESAMIDGCNEVQTFFRIVLPLSTPIIATIALFYAVARWNSFFDGVLYITDRFKKPMMVILRELLILSDNVERSADLDVGMNVKMATAFSTVIPILCVYPFLQKYFTKGIMLGAVKG
jgi:putative aldouronate transport system permease protein